MGLTALGLGGFRVWEDLGFRIFCSAVLQWEIRSVYIHIYIYIWHIYISLYIHLLRHASAYIIMYIHIHITCVYMCIIRAYCFHLSAAGFRISELVWRLFETFRFKT